MSDSLVQLQAHWLVSDKRKDLLWAIQNALATHLAVTIPEGSLVALLATECAAIALEQVDRLLSAPIQVDAGTISVVDYRDAHRKQLAQLAEAKHGK